MPVSVRFTQHKEAEMGARFVVVHAIPTETGSAGNGARFYATTVPAGFDIYDNRDKRRLKTTYPTRAEAEDECERRNAE
jgi:hypothetical protein